MEAGVGGQDPAWRVGVGRGSPLLCERNFGVWCSYEMCNVLSSLFDWLQQSSFVTRCISCVFTNRTQW